MWRSVPGRWQVDRMQRGYRTFCINDWSMGSSKSCVLEKIGVDAYRSRRRIIDGGKSQTCGRASSPFWLVRAATPVHGRQWRRVVDDYRARRRRQPNGEQWRIVSWGQGKTQYREPEWVGRGRPAETVNQFIEIRCRTTGRKTLRVGCLLGDVVVGGRWVVRRLSERAALTAAWRRELSQSSSSSSSSTSLSSPSLSHIVCHRQRRRRVFVRRRRRHYHHRRRRCRRSHCRRTPPSSSSYVVCRRRRRCGYCRSLKRISPLC